MVQPRLIVRGQGDDQRALGAQFHVHTRDLEQLGGESGPARLAFAAERDQGFLAGLGLGAGRQHAGGGVARATTSRAPVEYLNRRSPRRQSPRNGKADHPGADDGDIRLSDIRYGLVRQPAAPFAGMTQTGSMGMISAASARHPRPSNLMMGILARLHKAMGGAPPCRGRVGSQYAARWRSSREHTRPTVITTAAPRKMLASGPPWAKP